MDERLEQGSRGTPARRKLQRHRSTAVEDEENSDGVEEEASARPHLRNSARISISALQHSAPIAIAPLRHLTTGLGWRGGGGTPSAHITSHHTHRSPPHRSRPSC